MFLKFRKQNKKYYKIIITILICLLLGFLYLGNYNLRESLENNDISGNSTITPYQQKRADETKQAEITISSTGGNNGSDGYNAQIQAFALMQNLEGKNNF